MTRARHRAMTRRAKQIAVALCAAVLVTSGVTSWAAAAAAQQPAPVHSATAPGRALVPAADPALDANTGATVHDQDPAPIVSATPSSNLSVASVSIPSIGVDAPTEPLTRDSSGALQPPTSFSDTGWYQDGVLPGQVGPAVIAGHIDSTGAPAVFANLRLLMPGAAVHVTLSDGTVVSYTVDFSIQVPKGAFPTERVYGPTPDPQLRIITCAGTFDPAIGHYNDNIVVFASLA